MKEMGYIWDEDRDDILFFGSVYDLEELNALLNNCFTVLKKSQSAREMVLETWLALDFSIRKFLLSGFELSRFCDEDFDLKYKLLPNNFRAVLRLFQDTIRYNAKCNHEPDTIITDHRIKMPIGLFKYVREHHPGLMDKILEVENEYIIDQHPELKGDISNSERAFFFTTEPLDNILKPKRRQEKMNPMWRNVANRFDESWFALASQLNDARNIAAHSLNIDKIGACFGLKGDNLTELIREKCLSIMKKLLAIKIDEV